MTHNFLADQGSKPPVVVVVGPTGVGKTSTALRVANDMNGEIVSADSRQVYRYMDIGTAKPTRAECEQVPHHLVDFLEPDQTLTLAQFQKLAFGAIADISARGQVPMLVGGTGQYIRAVVEGWGIPEVPPNSGIRDELERDAVNNGPESLHDRLKVVDPIAADKIDFRNVRRVIRALEVYQVTGQPITELQARTPPPYEFLMIGLTRPRDILYSRIDRRIDDMVAQGLVAEVQALLARGYDWSLPSMSGLGYAQFRSYFSEGAPLEDAVLEVKRETRRFVRHQYNWFKLGDPAIRWIDLERELQGEALSVVRSELTKVGSSQS